MKKALLRNLIILLIFICPLQASFCESLFVMNASQSYYAEPKSLFSGVRARGVGDLVTIIMEEKINVQDNLTYGSNRSSNTVDNFTNFLNKLIPGTPFNKQFNNFGGSNTVESNTNNNRTMAMQDYVTVQVVQLLPNGNLMVQGKKTIVNASERVDLLISGVVDPRWINEVGRISSRNVANLQFALNGKGTTSRAGNEGVINRAVKYLF